MAALPSDGSLLNNPRRSGGGSVVQIMEASVRLGGWRRGLGLFFSNAWVRSSDAVLKERRTSFDHLRSNLYVLILGWLETFVWRGMVGGGDDFCWCLREVDKMGDVGCGRCVADGGTTEAVCVGRRHGDPGSSLL